MSGKFEADESSKLSQKANESNNSDVHDYVDGVRISL
jgi:hypothetical protein